MAAPLVAYSLVAVAIVGAPAAWALRNPFADEYGREPSYERIRLSGCSDTAHMDASNCTVNYNIIGPVHSIADAYSGTSRVALVWSRF
jgi:hypothetical protein